LKKESAAVQAADLLAWHWATDLKHQMTNRPRRKDFESLAQAPFRGVHFDKARLLYYIELLKEFGVSENHESSTMHEQVMRALYIQKRATPYLSI